MVKAAFGDQALSRSNVFWLYGRFRDGRKDIEDDPRNGRPTEYRNDNHFETINQLFLQNRHLSLRMLANDVNTGKDTVRKGKDTVRKGKDTVRKGKDTVRKGKDTLRKGKDTVRKGEDTVRKGKDTVRKGKDTVRRRVVEDL